MSLHVSPLAPVRGEALCRYLNEKLPLGFFSTFDIYAPHKRYHIYSNRHYYTHLAVINIDSTGELCLRFRWYVDHRTRILITGIVAAFPNLSREVNENQNGKNL